MRNYLLVSQLLAKFPPTLHAVLVDRVFQSDDKNQSYYLYQIPACHLFIQTLFNATIAYTRWLTTSSSKIMYINPHILSYHHIFLNDYF